MTCDKLEKFEIEETNRWVLHGRRAFLSQDIELRLNKLDWEGDTLHFLQLWKSVMEHVKAFRKVKYDVGKLAQDEEADTSEFGKAYKLRYNIG
jgi:hypothetical protein